MRIFCTTAAIMLLAGFRVSAHHAFAAEYDQNNVVEVRGTVTSFEWTNPHVWLHVEGKDGSGNVEKWSFEMGSPNGLVHRGWRRNELKAGDPLSVRGYRARDGRRVANAETVTFPDGRKLFGGFQSTPRLSGK